MSEYPDFKIEVADLHEAEFWESEWRQRFRDTNDGAFEEQADSMARYIIRNFEDELTDE